MANQHQRFVDGPAYDHGFKVDPPESLNAAKVCRKAADALEAAEREIARLTEQSTKFCNGFLEQCQRRETAEKRMAGATEAFVVVQPGGHMLLSTLRGNISSTTLAFLKTFGGPLEQTGEGYRAIRVLIVPVEEPKPAPVADEKPE